MNVSDILQKCSHLEIESRNDISEDHVEIVLLKEKTDEWKRTITEILGPAEKEAGVKITDSYFDLTKNFGGIQDDQTLYYKKFAEQSVIAMFWPWKDNHQVTIKIASFKE